MMHIVCAVGPNKKDACKNEQEGADKRPANMHKKNIRSYWPPLQEALAQRQCFRPCSHQGDFRTAHIKINVGSRIVLAGTRRNLPFSWNSFRRLFFVQGITVIPPVDFNSNHTDQHQITGSSCNRWISAAVAPVGMGFQTEGGCLGNLRQTYSTIEVLLARRLIADMSANQYYHLQNYTGPLILAST